MCFIGRRDACVKTNKRSFVLTPMEYDSKVLRGVNLNATHIFHWFLSRGMNVMSAHGCRCSEHTLRYHGQFHGSQGSSKFRSIVQYPMKIILRITLGVPSRPVHKLSAFVSDPESSGYRMTGQLNARPPPTLKNNDGLWFALVVPPELTLWRPPPVLVTSKIKSASTWKGQDRGFQVPLWPETFGRAR